MKNTQECKNRAKFQLWESKADDVVFMINMEAANTFYLYCFLGILPVTDVDVFFLFRYFSCH